MTPIRQMLVDSHGAIAIAEKSVLLSGRSGMAVHRFASERFESLHCGLLAGQNRLLLAGAQDSIVTADLERGTVVSGVPVDSHIVLMRQAKLLCCGSADGTFTFRDPRSFAVEQRLQPHVAGLVDFDVLGNYLATTGMSHRYRLGPFCFFFFCFAHRCRRSGLDPVVRVYDLRTFKALPSINVSSRPYLTKFHPKFTSMLVVATQTGSVMTLDVNAPAGRPGPRCC